MQTLSPEALDEKLEAAVADELPAPVRVEALERLTGGASRETWSFDAVDATGTRHGLILRRDFAERVEARDEAVPEIDRAIELSLQKVLHNEGVPVVRPLGAPRSELPSPIGSG